MSKIKINNGKNISNLISLINNNKNKNNSKKLINVKFTKENYSFLKVLEREGFINHFKILKSDNFNNKYIELNLNNTNNIWNIHQISKSGRRIYITFNNLLNLYKHRNIIYIIRTSKGLMTLQEAKLLHLGGELVSKVKFHL